VEPLVPFRHGEPVQVLSGALADRVGFFDCVTDEGRVILLLDMLGRQVKIKVPLESVAAVA
jgi:transcriptional antiterminator RfaH